LFHDPINAINAGGCLIVFTGVILYKVSLIYSNNHNAETYSPIDQHNENESDDNDYNKETLQVGKGRIHVDNSTTNRIIPRPRIERTSSAGSGNKGPSNIDYDSTPQEETDEFMEEGLQDKMLKLKL